ncbi:hypothetical protein LAZ67_1007511 [Cordylochernes scorpioides]|uniref:Uncharacterized protein n=1 Tax=Cordylochernes scorpioides TaxID=51811 RepID=A0ABY6K0T4_9ARAC|nr:hypothetical protein LAZ67_1007511 [Cordylochernes scorpioides]
MVAAVKGKKPKAKKWLIICKLLLQKGLILVNLMNGRYGSKDFKDIESLQDFQRKVRMNK